MSTGSPPLSKCAGSAGGDKDGPEGRPGDDKKAEREAGVTSIQPASKIPQRSFG